MSLSPSKPWTRRDDRFTGEDAVTYYRDFGQRLRMLRQVRGYAEQDAAATAGVTLRTWRRWKAGWVSRDSSLWVPAFANKYDVSCAWLISGKGPMAVSDYHPQMEGLKALPRFIAEQMVCGDRPMRGGHPFPPLFRVRDFRLFTNADTGPATVRGFFYPPLADHAAPRIVQGDSRRELIEWASGQDSQS
jgi:hypothetical protein